MHFFGFLHPGRSTYLFKSYKQKYRGDKTVLINNGSNRREQAPKDITDIEPVTLLWLIVSSKPGSGASANPWAIARTDWTKIFDEGFHERPNQTAGGFAVMGWRGYTSSIVRVGWTIASRYQTRQRFECYKKTFQNFTRYRLGADIPGEWKR